MSETTPDFEQLAQGYVNDISLAIWHECSKGVSCGYTEVSLSDTGTIEEDDDQATQVSFIDLDCNNNSCPYADTGTWGELRDRVAEITIKETYGEETETNTAIEAIKVNDYLA